MRRPFQLSLVLTILVCFPHIALAALGDHQWSNGYSTGGALHRFVLKSVVMRSNHHEFEAMRVAGIRHADLKGYMYGRTDVLARSLASAFSQTLADIFTHQVKPYEVEILVVELSDDDGPAALYRVLYDGTLADESGFAAIGGQAEALAAKVADGFDPSADLAASIRHAAGAFTAVSEDPIAGWEAAVLEANGKRRTFRRLEQAELETALSDDG